MSVPRDTKMLAEIVVDLRSITRLSPVTMGMELSASFAADIIEAQMAGSREPEPEHDVLCSDHHGPDVPCIIR